MSEKSEKKRELLPSLEALIEELTRTGSTVARLELEDNLALARKAKAEIRNFQANLDEYYEGLDEIRSNILDGR